MQLRDDFSRETTVDEFEDAFNEGSGAGTVPDPTPPADLSAAPANKPADQGDGGEQLTTGQEQTPPADEQQEQTAPAADVPDAAKLQQKISTLQGMLTKVSADVKAERDARIAAEEAARKAAEQAAATQTQKPAAPTEAADDEDEALLAELRETAPSLAKGLEAMLKRQRRELDKDIADKYGKPIEQVRSDLKPIQERIQTQAELEHETAIESAHPGWKQAVESQDFMDWARSQPSYVREQLVRVSQEGTASQVIEVLDSYRKEHPANQSNKPAAGAGNDTNAKRQLQRQAVTGVPNRPAPTTTSGIQKTDFDAGFEAAASTQ